MLSPYSRLSWEKQLILGGSWRQNKRWMMGAGEGAGLLHLREVQRVYLPRCDRFKKLLWMGQSQPERFFFGRERGCFWL